MNQKNYAAMIQTYVARTAVGPSTVRGQGPNVVRRGREHLSLLDLRSFSLQTASAFERRLESATEDLASALPRSARSWGLARKILNIFLRHALYSRQLAEHYALLRIAPYLELPLDAITTSYLRKKAGRGVLPRWTGVRNLKREASAEYQAHAASIADDLGLVRVDLDAFWWGGRPSGDDA